eukprot:TRINITY_DN3965_c0_g2_i1.p1 TRINITY_DN3965_c0_g2~~TRINITY_DN3965_c0_g2_i1.p1  ORF type:complete len:655 (+),score=133.83 TRINITY_DN3965_c0_g2_i1:47-2011(+)
MTIFDYTYIVIPTTALVLLFFYYRSRQPTSAPVIAASSATMPTGQIKSKKKQEEPEEHVDESAIPVKIFYASQTGTAEQFSKRLAQESKGYKFRPQVVDMEHYELENLSKEKFAFFVCATYGEGEPTDNAREFWNWLKSDGREKDLLSGLQYTVFGLGNKTYEQFNAFSRAVDARLADLGAKSIFPRGEGDDDANLEEDFLTWKDQMWPAVCKNFGLSSESAGGNQTSLAFKIVLHEKDSALTIGSNEPHMMQSAVKAKVIENRELHSTKSDRSCRHITVDCSESGLSYETGDHLAVFPLNAPDLVNAYAKRLGFDLDQLFSLVPVDSSSNEKSPFPTPCTVREALTKYCDLTHIASRMILKAMSECATDAKEKAHLGLLASTSEEAKKEYDSYVKHAVRNPLDVLEDHASVQMPLETFLQVISPLQCRYYSISSSNLHSPNSIDITAVLVQFTSPIGKEKFGVCTRYLCSVPASTNETPVYLKCQVRRSTFKLPTDPKVPVVMVGPGTGLAPFRGFVQERHALRKQKGADSVGPTVLYFGCRNREIDFIYEEELLSYARDGSLTELHVAFSRESEKKQYVQHKMAETKESIFKHVYEQNGYFYICGEALNMAKDVRNTLTSIISEYAKLDEESAKQYVETMLKDGRMQLDVWS